MKVLLDATAMPPQRLGSAHVTSRLAAALAPLVDLHVLTSDDDLPGTLHHVRRMPRPVRLVWEQTVAPWISREADVYYGPHYTLPLARRGPMVVTFHDPFFFTHPDLHERSKVAYFRRMIPLACKRARRVVAVSQFSADGAVRFGHADPSKVDVIWNAVDHAVYAPGAVDTDALDRLGVRPPYVYWTGAWEPRKDVPTLVRAMPDGMQLVLGGARAWGAADIDAAIAASGKDVRVIGYTSERDKVALYRGAALFAYPSIAEGFGNQVLEAMACGCPVVTTTGSAPEEVGGDAVELVPPGDVDALRSAIDRVASSPEGYRERGLRRAAGVTWEDAARRYLESFRLTL